MSIPIIHENKDFLVINKPANLLVHPVNDKNLKEKTLISWLIKNYPQVKDVGDRPDIRPGIVHRLDRDTSGVMVIALSQEYFDHLKKQFKKREVEKKYLALVFGKIEKEGIIEKDIGLKPNTTRWTTWVKKSNAKMVKNALTLYKPIKVIEKNNIFFTLVELYPKTGRTHQLRVHMESIGKPIVGDPQYGPGENSWGLKRQFLHANSIKFKGLGGEIHNFIASLPDELERIINYYL